MTVCFGFLIVFYFILYCKLKERDKTNYARLDKQLGKVKWT